MPGAASTQFRIVIPARFGSQRLPGKPLRRIHDRPMIEWVYRAAQRTAAVDIVVATDDERIASAVEHFGGRACMTSDAHRSGTDRILEVARRFDWSDDCIVVNLQGDEPMMPPVNIDQVATNLVDSGCDMATLHREIDAAHAQDPNHVKLVHDHRGHALYFSRAPVPYHRDGKTGSWHGHIGLYAYRVGFIDVFSRLPHCELELNESLEQLRALYNGYSIHSEIAHAAPGPGIDTEADLQRAEQMLAPDSP